MHEAAANRPAVADSEVPDFSSSTRQKRLGCASFIRDFELTMSGQGADAERAVFTLDERQVGKPVQVDERIDLGHAQVEQRHEALPAGKELGAFTPLGKESERLLDRAWAGVGEFGRFHT